MTRIAGLIIGHRAQALCVGELTLLVVSDLRELVRYSIGTIYPVSHGLRNQQK